MLCLGCRYPLAGLTEHRCPECGRLFDPLDAATVLVPGVMMLAAALSRPPGRCLRALASVSAALTLLAFSADSGYLGIAVAATFGWAVIAGLLAVRICSRLFIPRWRHRLRVSEGRFWWPVLGMALLPVLAGALCYCEVPLRVRLLISLPFLNAAADEAERSPATVVDVEGWHGPVHAIVGFKVGGGVAFELWERDPGRWYGRHLARLPTAPAGPLVWGSATLTVRHLWGDWYEWSWGPFQPAWRDPGRWSFLGSGLPLE